MASRIAEAYVQIVPRIDGIGSSLTKGLSSEMGAAGETGAKSFAGGFKKFAGPAIAASIAIAGAALISFGKNAIAAAEEAKQADARVDQIAKSMGIFGKETSVVTDRLKDYAKQNMLVLGADDEVIKSTQAKLLTFKELALTADETGGSFDRATAAAFDLASAGFGSAETNAVQLGKALQDPVKGITALARSGVTFTEVEKEKIKALVQSGNILEAQNMVLGAIENQVGGTAAATLTASEKIKIGFGNIQEAAGNALLPAFEGIANFLSTKFFPFIEGGLSKLPALFESMGAAITPFIDGFKTAFTGAGGGIEGFMAGLMDLRQRLFDAFLTALPGIIQAIVAFIPTLVQNSVAMITALITAITESLPAIIDGAIQLFNGILEGLLQALPVIIEGIVTAIPQIITALVSALPSMIQGALQLFLGIVKGLITALPQIITAIVGAIPQFIKAITDALPQLIDGAIDLFLGVIDGLTQALPQIITAVIDAMPKIVAALIDAVPLFIEAGIELLKGLAKGIIDNIPKIIGGAIQSVADFAVNTFKGLMGIKSPSTVFAGFGSDLMTGLAVGITSTAKAPIKALEQAANGIAKAGVVLVDPISKNIGVRFTEEFIKAIADNGNGLFARLDKEMLGQKAKSWWQNFAGNDQLMTNMGLGISMIDARTGRGPKGLQKGSFAIENAIKSIGNTNFNMTAGAGQGWIDFLQGGISFEKGNSSTTIAGGSNKILDIMRGDDAAIMTAKKYLDQGMKLVGQPGLNTALLRKIVDGDQAARDLYMANYEKILLAAGTEELGPGAANAAKKVAASFKPKAKGKAKPKAKPKKKMALGGFVTGPTNALIGEAGPELVYPLDRFEKVMGIDNGGAAKVINYYAAPNQSLNAENALFTAMKRAKVIVGW